MRVKFAVGLWLFGRLADRFTVYHEAKDLRGKIEEAARVRGRARDFLPSRVH